MFRGLSMMDATTLQVAGCLVGVLPAVEFFRREDYLGVCITAFTTATYVDYVVAGDGYKRSNGLGVMSLTLAAYVASKIKPDTAYVFIAGTALSWLCWRLGSVLDEDEPRALLRASSFVYESLGYAIVIHLA